MSFIDTIKNYLKNMILAATELQEEKRNDFRYRVENNSSIQLYSETNINLSLKNISRRGLYFFYKASETGFVHKQKITLTLILFNRPFNIDFVSYGIGDNFRGTYQLVNQANPETEKSYEQLLEKIFIMEISSNFQTVSNDHATNFLWIKSINQTDFLLLIDEYDHILYFMLIVLDFFVEFDSKKLKTGKVNRKYFSLAPDLSTLTDVDPAPDKNKIAITHDLIAYSTVFTDTIKKQLQEICLWNWLKA